MCTSASSSASCAFTSASSSSPLKNGKLSSNRLGTLSLSAILSDEKGLESCGPEILSAQDGTVSEYRDKLGRAAEITGFGKFSPIDIFSTKAQSKENERARQCRSSASQSLKRQLKVQARVAMTKMTTLTWVS